MTVYRVECIGEAREVYLVEADSPEAAQENWHTGDLVVSEASSMEPTSAQVESDG